MKIVKGVTRFEFTPMGTQKGHLSSVGTPVDLTPFINGMEGLKGSMQLASEAIGTFAIGFASGRRRHGMVKHQRDLRRARAKKEARR